MPFLKRICQYSLLSWAVAILLLHSLVPHQHHSSPLLEPSITNCTPTESGFLGFLGKVFHQDLGDEHLENFKHTNKVSFGAYLIPFLTILSFEFSPIVTEAARPIVLSTEQLLPSPAIIGPPLLRGPPFA